MNLVQRKLIAKDMRQNLPLMAMIVTGGIIALVLMGLGRAGFAIGGILFITSNLAGGFFIGAFAIMQERKDQSHQFALSLPISVRQLNRTKLLSALIVYAIPWTLLTVLACGLVLLNPKVPDGTVVYALLIQGFILTLTCAYLSVISASRSEVVSAFSILALNMMFSLFMVSLSQPAFRDPISTERVAWPDYALLIFGSEGLVICLSLGTVFYLLSRRREFI
jgi:ABC-2 type transport system permease protein